MRVPVKPLRPAAALAALLIPLLAGCASIKRMAVNKIGDMLAEGGTVYESDDDPELVGDAVPFGLKLMESLLAQSPEHPGMLQAACSGFTTYSYAWVQSEADRIRVSDLDRGDEMRARARRLYDRARGYGLRGLETKHPGIGALLETDPAKAVSMVTKKDEVPLLYWNAAALGLAISVSLKDAAMLARLPEVDALLRRALELDEAWQDGALHEFAITLAGARPGFGVQQLPDLRKHFDRAKTLSEGQRASLFVTWAGSISVRTQNADEFRARLDEALAIDPDGHPEIRLANLIAQRQARWLRDRTEDLFLDTGAGEAPGGDLR